MIELGTWASREAQRDLLRRVAGRRADIQGQAAALDAAAAFPHESFAALKADGLLAATLPEHLGGAGFGEGADGAAALNRLLYLLGQANLAVARIFEAHVNALQLILRYGTPGQAETAARDAHAGHLFGLWVTDPLNGGGVLLDRNMVLQGEKAICSGAGVASRALITAQTPAGAQMLVVALPAGAPERVRPSRVKLAGMRAAITGAIDFTGMQLSADAVLGVPEDYLREPVFSAGAWRSAAAALGGLGALVELHRTELVKRGRDADAHQRARFGQVVIAHETARLWMDRAALRGCLEDEPAEAIVAYINLARIAVESACLDGLRHTQRSLGIQAFMDGSKVERLCRDLSVYLRQPAPDETLDRAAAHYFVAGPPGL